MRSTSASADRAEAGLVGRLEQIGPCLRLRTGSTSYLLIWPFNSTARPVDGALEVTDVTTGGVARVGSRTSVTGGEAEFETAALLPLSEPFPGECRGRLWIVGEIRKTSE